MGITSWGVLRHWLVSSYHFLKLILHEKGLFLTIFGMEQILDWKTFVTNLPSTLGILAHSNYSLVVQTLPVIGRSKHILDFVFEVLMAAQSSSWDPS